MGNNKRKDELRLVISIALLIVIIIIPILLLSLPSKIEKLAEKSWCVDKIIYKGQELTPNSLGLKMVSEYANCSEIMSFRKNGIVDFPGINSYGDRCRWELRNDSLIITQWNIGKNYEINEELKITENERNVEKSIFHGVYKLEIKNNLIKMQSDSLTIFGHVYIFNY